MRLKQAWAPIAVTSAIALSAAAWTATRVEVVSDTVCGRLLKPNNLHSPVCADFYRRQWAMAGALVIFAAILAVAAFRLHRQVDPTSN